MGDDDKELNPETSVLLKDPHQQYLYAVETVRQLRARLIRRTNVIDEIRKFYLRDVVTMKNVLNNFLSGSEKEAVWKEYDAALPSIDLKPLLKLHAPTGGEFKVKPCEKCGGQLEIVMKDTDEVERLKKVLNECKERENRWREKLATLDVQIEEALKEKAESGKGHQEEKRVMYAEMKKLREAAEKYKHDAIHFSQQHKKIKEDHENFLKKNADLLEAHSKLQVAEQELISARLAIELKDESIKELKIVERNLTTDLQISQNSVVEANKEKEKLLTDLTEAKNEMKAVQTTLSTVNEQLNQNQVKIQALQKENQEMAAQNDSFQSEMLNLRIGHTQAMEGVAKELDIVKFDLRELNATFAETDNELETQKQHLTEAQTKIDELTNLNKKLESELLDNADEIELFEEEISAMQQFIREKISQQDTTGDDDADSIMREFEEFRDQLVQDEDEEEEEEDEEEEEEQEVEEEVENESGHKVKTITKVNIHDIDDPIQPPSVLLRSPSGRVKKQPSSKNVARQNSGKKATSSSKQSSARPVVSQETKEEDAEEADEVLDDENIKPPEEAHPSPSARDRRQAMAVQRKSKRKLGGSSGDVTNNNSNTTTATPIPTTSNAPATAASLRRQLRATSQANMNAAAAAAAAEENNTNTDEHEKEKVDEENNDHETENEHSEIESSSRPLSSSNNPGAAANDTSASKHTQKLLLQQRGEKKAARRQRRSSVATTSSSSSHRKASSKAVPPLKKQRSFDSDVSDQPSTPTALIMNPDVLMKLNQRESFFGIPDQKQVLQKEETKKRRRSIPKNFIYYDLVTEPLVPLILPPLQVAAATTTVTNSETGEVTEQPVAAEQPKVTVEVVKRKKMTSEDFANHTKEMLHTTKGKLKDIKNMLLETPPSSARGGFNSARSRESHHDRKQRKSKMKKVKIQEDDNDSLGTDGNNSLQNTSRSLEKLEAAPPAVVAVEKETPKEAAKPNTYAQNRSGNNSAAPSKPSSAVPKKENAPSSSKDSKGKPNKIVVPTVELSAPPENATKFELAFRMAILTIIRNTKGMNENFTHTVFNGLNEFVHQFCSTLYELFQGMWTSLSSSKVSLDLLQKFFIVFSGMNELNTNPNGNTMELGTLCASIVPLAGTTLNASVTQQWQDEVKLDEEMLLSLLPTIVNYETNERKIKSLTDYLEDTIRIYPYDPKFLTTITEKSPLQIRAFNPNMNENGIDETVTQYFPKFSQMESGIIKIHDYINSLNSSLSAMFIEILRDWSSAKTIAYELDKRLENERERTRKPLEMKVQTISKELSKITSLYEKNLDLTRNYEIKLKEYEKFEGELKKSELKVIDTQKEVASLAEKLSDLTIKYHKLLEENKELCHTINRHETTMDNNADEIKELKTHVKELEAKVKGLIEALDAMTELKNKFETQTNELLDLEDRRRNRIVSVSMQTEPERSEIGLQTEFFMPPVSFCSCFFFFFFYLMFFSVHHQIDGFKNCCGQ
jgi:hypothetical protein